MTFTIRKSNEPKLTANERVKSDVILEQSIEYPNFYVISKDRFGGLQGSLINQRYFWDFVTTREKFKVHSFIVPREITY